MRTRKAATCAAHSTLAVRQDCMTRCKRAEPAWQAMRAVACMQMQRLVHTGAMALAGMHGRDAPSARPRSTRMTKNCVVLCIAAHHGKEDTVQQRVSDMVVPSPCPHTAYILPALRKEPVRKGASGYAYALQLTQRAAM